MFCKDIARCIRKFLVLIACHDGFRIVLDLYIVTFRSIGCSCRKGRENLHNLGLNQVHIYITNNDNSLLVRTVPCMVIVPEHLIREVVYDFHSTYRKALTILVARENSRENALVSALLGIGTASPLLVDNTPLLVNFFIGEQKTAGPVTKDEKAGVN